MLNSDKFERRNKRKAHIRKTVEGTPERPRLSVRRTLKHVYAQAIDDTKGATLAYASSLEAEGEKAKKKDSAKKVGALVAKRLLDQKIEKVVFDRNGNLYHGRVAAVAEGAREAGLKF